jgi:predicted permease
MISPARLYRVLLLLYPPGYRRRFGREMLEFLEARVRRLPDSELWSFVLQDVARSLPTAWFAAWHGVLIRLRRKRSTSLLYPDLAPHSTRRGVISMFATPFRDLRFAMRNLRRTPGFTAAAIGTLALGVGANTAIFSVVNGVILRPLPYHEPENLVMVQIQYADGDGSVSYAHSQPDIHDIQTEVQSIEASAGYQTTAFTITGGGEPEVVRGIRVTNGLFDVFHVAPVIGRDLRAEENVPAGPLVAVIGHSFWQERFGGDPDVIGETIELSERRYEIVGVAPAGFDFTREAQIWVPLYHDLEGCARGCHFIRFVARLRQGVTIESAQSELSLLATRLQEAYVDTNYGKELRLITLADTVYGNVRTGLFVMLGAVGFVLLIACANVANLLLARGTARTGEIAVRSALGASRGRLVTQLLIEALVLAALGGALGVGLARGGLGALLKLAPSNLPRLEEIAVDAGVLVFALGTVTIVTFLFGLMPAFRLANTSVSETLNHSGRGEITSTASAWSRSALLVGEVALSLMLLFGAGLLLRSFSQLNAVDLGFDKERVLTFVISLPEARYDADEAVRFFEQLETQVAAVPGVEAVGSVLGSPMGGSSVGGSFKLLDRPEPPPGQEPSAMVRAVTSGYLETLRVPLLRGRGFEPSDRIDSRPVVLVSEQFVKRHYPEKDPLGEQIELHVSFGYDIEEPYTIVGVVGDVRSRSLRDDPVPEMYVVQAQSGTDFLRVLARLAPGATDVLPAIRREVRTIDPNIPLRGIEQLETAVERAFGPARFYLLLLSIFAGVAVTLAAIGLYGVVAYLVSRRTREIGIRIALGAHAGDVVRLVLRQGMVPAGLGIALGLLGAWGASRVLGSLLYNVAPEDPITFAVVTALLLGIVVLAILIPARKASRIAPVEALRTE